MSTSDGVITMEIAGCRPEDSGKYTCVATNIHGQDETSCVVIVEGASNTPEQTKIAEKILHSGDRKYIEQPIKPAPIPVTIKKPVPSTAPTTTAPVRPSSLNISKSGSNLSVNDMDKRSPKKYGRLDSAGSPNRSRSATKELARKCFVLLFLFIHLCNIHLENKKNIFLVPPDDSTMCAPKFTKELSNLTIQDGESLSLICHVKGDPEPQITWTKNNKVSLVICKCVLVN